MSTAKERLCELFFGPRPGHDDRKPTVLPKPSELEVAGYAAAARRAAEGRWHTATVTAPPGKGAMYGAVTIALDVPSPFPWGRPTFEVEVVDDGVPGPGLVLWVRPSNAPRHMVTPRGGGGSLPRPSPRAWGDCRLAGSLPGQPRLRPPPLYHEAPGGARPRSREGARQPPAAQTRAGGRGARGADLLGIR